MKKYWLFALAVLTITGCAEGNSNGTGNGNGNNNTPTQACGDGVLNKNEGEVCDTGLEVACSAVDSTKTWKEGGKATCNNCKAIELGTCEEIQNMCGTPTAVCQSGDTKPCAEFDNTKKWQAGGMATCAADCGSFVIGTCVEELCGNMQIDNGEACDKALALNCNAFNAEVNWKPGGAPVCAADCSAIEIGTCVEDTGNVVPPTTKCGTSEAKCSANDNLTCADFDSTKTWKEGGKANCAADCSAIEIGTCVEDTGNVVPPTTKCGTSEAKCSANDNLTCADFDSTKTWKEGGKANCAADCSAIEIGTCVETECTQNSDCGDGKMCDNNTCVDIPICGNGKLDAGEACEFEDKKECKDVDPKWMSGQATCTDCNLDTSNCVANETLTGLYFCQLLDPVSVKFDPTKKSETVNVTYRIGSDITESNMTAELVYGVDFKQMAKWKSVAATQNADDDKFSATLQDSHVSSYGDTIHYTFRIKTNNNAEWQYCKRNNPDTNTDADMIQADLKPYTLKEEGQISSNVNETGSATITTIASSNIIAEFNFDDNTKVTTGASLSGYTADDGNGIITSEDNAWCHESKCFVNDENGGNALSLKNWVSTKTNLLDKNGKLDAAHIDISSLKTVGINHVNLDMQIRRNSTESPTNLVVYYTTQSATVVEHHDITLKTTGSNNGIQTYFDYNLELPEAVGNQSELTIHLAPYGGNGLLRFDNIVISKAN